MEERISEANIYRKAYERQNPLLLGAAGVMVSAVCIVAVCIIGFQASAFGRSRGQIKVHSEKAGVTQELLDYLGTLDSVRAAAPVIELEGSLKMGDYTYSGTITGIDLSAYPFEYAASGQEAGSSITGLVLGGQVPYGFEKTDGGKIGDSQRQILIQKLVEEPLVLDIRGAYVDQTGSKTQKTDQEESQGQEAVVEGILKLTGDQTDKNLYMDYYQAGKICRMMGESDAPGGLLIELYHKKDAGDILKVLGDIGFQGENPYKAELEEQTDLEKNLRIYFGMAGLLLLFSGLYMKRILFS